MNSCDCPSFLMTSQQTSLMSHHHLVSFSLRFKDFQTLEDAVAWYDALPKWKRIWYTILYYPNWPYTVKGSDFIDIGKVHQRKRDG